MQFSAISSSYNVQRVATTGVAPVKSENNSQLNKPKQDTVEISEAGMLRFKPAPAEKYPDSLDVYEPIKIFSLDYNDAVNKIWSLAKSEKESGFEYFQTRSMDLENLYLKAQIDKNLSPDKRANVLKNIENEYVKMKKFIDDSMGYEHTVKQDNDNRAIIKSIDENFIKNGATDYILSLLTSINDGDIEKAMTIIDNAERRATEYQFNNNETSEEERERIRKLQEEEIKQRREKFLEDFYKK